MNEKGFLSEDFQGWIDGILSNAGISATWLPYLKVMLLTFILLLLSYLSYQLAKAIILKLLHKIFERTSTKIDDLLIEHKVFNNLAHIVPALVIKFMAPVVFNDFSQLLPLIFKVTDIYIIIVIMMVIFALMKSMEFLLSSSPVFKDKPIAGYFQLARIIFYITGGILVLSILMGRSPIYFLSAFGAMTAILLLVFKDTILGLVASVQMSANDMVRVGDWVEMSKFNADGDVIAMNLNTVKIRNWDKTISTIPTYFFITDSFKNWRGMQESGGRRIKRAIFINLRSVKFVDQAMRERFKKYYLIKDYVVQRQQEIEQYNQEHGIDTSELINGRRMTNIGVFRHYTENYLKTHQRIKQDMTLLVRQLAPGDHGLPIEIYCFTNTTAWAEYEEIQSDIFDHLLAAAKHFELDVFQSPSGKDIILAGKGMRNMLN